MKPGAFSITALHTRNDEERHEISRLSEQVSAEVMGMRGFISFMGVGVAGYMMTITAWENVEAVDQLVGSPAQREAVKWMHREDAADGGMLSVWQPVRTTMLQRCPACRALTDVAAGDGTCRSCGGAVTAQVPYI